MTTTASTLAILCASLAAAERRLAAANDELDAAQEAHDDAQEALARAYGNLDVRTGEVRTSSYAGRAWDVDITILDVDGVTVAEGEVTLKVGEYDGRPSSWGDLDHWVSDALRGTLTGHRDLIGTVEHVAREAIEASDVPRSAEYEG